MSCTLPLPIPVPLTALHADYPPIHLGVKVSNSYHLLKIVGGSLKKYY